jgi:hypothetical protein
VKNPDEVIEVAVFNSDSARLRDREGKSFGVGAVKISETEWDTRQRLMRAIFPKEPRTSVALAFTIPADRKPADFQLELGDYEKQPIR